MRRLPQDLAQAPNTQGGPAVLVASEEQFKVFTPPKMSAKTKFKLTAHEGCRVCKVALATFASVACDDYAETCLASLTNLGNVVVFPAPDACSAHSFSSARGLRCTAASSTQWPVVIFCLDDLSIDVSGMLKSQIGRASCRERVSSPV